MLCVKGKVTGLPAGPPLIPMYIGRCAYPLALCHQRKKGSTGGRPVAMVAIGFTDAFRELKFKAASMPGSTIPCDVRRIRTVAGGHDMDVIPTFSLLLSEFRCVFTAPSFRIFMKLMTGWVLSHRRRFVTDLILLQWLCGQGTSQPLSPIL